MAKLLKQACAIPFRWNRDQLEICLITSLRKQRWIVPKGIIDPGETHEETALKEAFEEAGIRGKIVGEPLGSYQDEKWGCQLHVTVLLMKVQECEQDWLEADSRERLWASPSKAHQLISKSTLRDFVEIAVERIANT